MNIYERRGVRTLINAKGPATRLSGGIMRPEVTAAMAEAAGHCVDMAELQAHASQVIAGVTGAEAGYVASGAAACLHARDRGLRDRPGAGQDGAPARHHRHEERGHRGAQPAQLL